MNVYDVTGSYGPWQRRVFFVFLYINFIGMWQTLSITFLAPNVDFRCVEPLPPPLDPSSSNATGFDDRCEVVVSNTTTPCTKWEYDTANFSNTIVSEWDLVCDRQWLVSLAKSVYMFGFLVSVVFFGQVSDWVGRFPAIVAAYVVSCLGMFLSLLSNSYAMFAVLRFVQAFGRTGLTTTGFVLLMELVGPEHRTAASVLVQLGWAAGFTVLPVLAWFVRDWFWIQLVISIALLPFLVGLRFVPESPRWLLMRGKNKRLERLLTAAAAINGRELKVDVKQLLNDYKGKEDEKTTKTLFHVLKMPKMRNRTFILFYLWLVNAFMYYALSFNTNDIAGDPYLNFFVAGALEFPSYALLYWGIVRMGRRPTLFWLMMGGGAPCVAILAVPESLLWLRTVFAMAGKFCVTGSFGLLYIYTNELFPTVVRNVTLGSCSMCARIGSILAPFVRELGLSTHPSVPNVLYGVLALSSGLLALLLPETRGRTLPDTMEEGEEYGDKLPLPDCALRDSSHREHLMHPLLPQNGVEIKELSQERSDKSRQITVSD